MTLPSVWLRLLARLIDAVIVLVAGSALSFGIGPIGIVVIAAAYETTLVATKGQTVGKMATRIKIVRADSGNVPGWGAAASRWAVLYFAYIVALVIEAILSDSTAEAAVSSAASVVGLLVGVSLLWDRRRQGWQDKAARTLVVNTPEQTERSHRVAKTLGITAVVAIVVGAALLVAAIIIAFVFLIDQIMLFAPAPG